MSDLSRLCAEYGMNIAVYRDNPPPVPPGFPAGSRAYYVTLIYKDRSMVLVPFFCGPGIERDPTAADVLSCLISDSSALDAGSFEEWAREYGYSEDSRKAERTYRACLKIGADVRTLLGADFDLFARAEH